MIITKRAYPRAALIGNPSDGYFGKTIAFVFGNYCAEVVLYETPEIELLPSLRDHAKFSSIKNLSEEVGLYGYYGGIRLLKATIKRFYDYCNEYSIELKERNFTLRYNTTIPNRLGLAGSSAIITATVLALKQFYGIKIPKPQLANLVLSVEKEELGIDAGLQDRVAQAYNTPVFMDFNKEYMDEHGYGLYMPIEIPAAMKIYIAFRTDLAEGSEILHSRLREDYENGVPKVLAAIEEWANLTVQVKDCMDSGDLAAIPKLMNRNFDLRCEVCTISPKNRMMVELARSVGASAKFTGSGGAIIGTYEDEKMFGALKETLSKFKIEVVKPEIMTAAVTDEYST
jgi:glucuronokinase